MFHDTLCHNVQQESVHRKVYWSGRSRQSKYIECKKGSCTVWTPSCVLVMVILDQSAFSMSVGMHGPIGSQSNDVTSSLSWATMIKTFMYPLLLFPPPNIPNRLEKVSTHSAFQHLGMIWNARTISALETPDMNNLVRTCWIVERLSILMLQTCVSKGSFLKSILHINVSLRRFRILYREKNILK